ncbi:protease II [Bradyrhizobium sp. LB13.1]
MTQAKTPSQPPIAPRRPHSITQHGITVTDDYAWLKDEKWQEVLRDPAVLDPDIRKYLDEENGYTESLLGHTAALQKSLVREMRGRIKEDDSSVPSPDGEFAYFRKFREGGQHELFGRMPRDGGEGHIVLDGDALAKDHAYFKFGGSRHSNDHKLQAWSADTKGSEYFSIRVRDWATGKDLDDVVEETDGGVVWSKDATSFFYVKLDDNHRPMQVWRHKLGTRQADDTLVYEEQDSGWFTHLHESTSGRFCVIAGGDHETSEQRLIDLVNPKAPPRLVAAREEGVQYSLGDRGDELFILTNADDAIDFKDRHCTAQFTRAQELARFDPVSTGYLHHRSRSLCRPSGAAGARQRAAIHRDPRSRIERGACHRLRRGGLFARHDGLLRVRDDHAALRLFVDDDAVGSL